MLRPMKKVKSRRAGWKILTGLLFSMVSVYVVHADTWSMTAEQWARPRSGKSLLEMQSIASAVKALNNDMTSVLLVRYPGGEEGALWAFELRDWLVSLGVPSTRIELYAGQSDNGTITLGLKKSEGE